MELRIELDGGDRSLLRDALEAKRWRVIKRMSRMIKERRGDEANSLQARVDKLNRMIDAVESLSR